MLHTEFEPFCEGTGREKDVKTRVWLPLCATAVLLAAVVAIATENQRDDAKQPSVSAVSAEAVRAPGIAGLKTYRDQVTGERRSPAPGLVVPALTPTERNARSRSYEGLVQVQGATPEDGVMVDLRGRFRSSVVSVRQPDGSYAMKCLDEVPHVARGE